MKLRKQHLFSLALLTLLTVGIFGLSSPVGSVITADKVKFTPKYLDMTNTPYLEVMVKLTDADNLTLVEQIDNTSVTLEGMIAPSWTWIEYNKKDKPISFHAEFSATAVNGMLWYLVSHMDLTMPRPWVPIPISLTISGKLTDGPPATLWEGSAIALLVNWSVVFPPD